MTTTTLHTHNAFQNGLTGEQMQNGKTEKIDLVKLIADRGTALYKLSDVIVHCPGSWWIRIIICMVAIRFG